MAGRTNDPGKEGAVTEQHSQPVGGPEAAAAEHAAGPAKRRRGIRVAAIVLAVLAVLVVVSGVIAVQPGVIGGRAPLKVEYDTWLASKHGDVPCQGCHASPTLLGQLGYGTTMIGELFLSAVPSRSATAAFASPTNAACIRCHKDLITTSPKGDLIIPHRAHTDILKVACVTCHAYLVHEKSPEGKHTPTMAGCLTCHNGTQAKNACATCHTAKATPDTHKATGWLVTHPVAAATTDCATCHGWTKDWCADCHARRPQSHTADWREAHAVAVATRRNCESCHVASFCIECHGLVPERNYDPNVTLVK